ncbi:MAG: hypothetical protein EON90_08870 [Brevundimonas sp.]|nr:MAG: hypothetical protein EON90_08870 [Brevundimonas sp.]
MARKSNSKMKAARTAPAPNPAPETEAVPAAETVMEDAAVAESLPDAAPTPSFAEPTPLQDFLEKYVTDGVRREQTLEEAVWRSIPAFLITLGVIGAVLAFSIQQLSANLGDPLGLVGLACAALGAVAVVVGGWRLSTAVRSRAYAYPADELFIVETADALRRQYEYDGDAPGLAEAKALSEKRREVLLEWATSASHNHMANKQKAAACAASAQWMFAAAAFAVLAGAFALFVDAPPARADRLQAPRPVVAAAPARSVPVEPAIVAPAPRPVPAAAGSAPAPQRLADRQSECSEEPVWPRRLSSQRNDCAITSAGSRPAG